MLLKFKYWIFAIVDRMFRYLLKEGEYSRHTRHTPKIGDKQHKVIPFKAKLSSLERRVKAARYQK